MPTLNVDVTGICSLGAIDSGLDRQNEARSLAENLGLVRCIRARLRLSMFVADQDS